MSTIHNRILSLRKRRGLSMEQLADAVGVSWQAVQRWENGGAAPKRTRLAAVAQTLETTQEYLLTGIVRDGSKAAAHTAQTPTKAYGDRTSNVSALTPKQSREIEEIMSLISRMSEKGHVMLLTHARSVAKEYPAASANTAK